MENAVFPMEIFTEVFQYIGKEHFDCILPIALTCKAFSEYISENTSRIAKSCAELVIESEPDASVFKYVRKLPNGLKHGCLVVDEVEPDMVSTYENWVFGARTHVVDIYYENMGFYATQLHMSDGQRRIMINFGPVDDDFSDDHNYDSDADNDINLDVLNITDATHGEICSINDVLFDFVWISPQDSFISDLFDWFLRV